MEFRAHEEMFYGCNHSVKMDENIYKGSQMHTHESSFPNLCDSMKYAHQKKIDVPKWYKVLF